MHGVKRTKVSPEAAEAKRLKELGKIQAYLTLEEDVLARDYSPEALKKTTELLDLNPEFYTVWNYRRHILTREIVALLGADLRLTVAYLKVHPKVYWIWTHRMWCLENIPRGPGDTEGWRNEMWKVEFGLVEKLLESDARNFHAWGYRRYILRSLPETAEKRTPQDELKYTTRKIEASFSNFSAWHYRTKLLGKMFEDMTPEQIAEKKDEGELHVLEA
ncbi:RAB-protein geranylgeranyltransferase [Trichosporon asahii var. asahii CBS 8904]|uniref:Geranylgeranyl transferase type-2 subunit alpha n=1 Tax=Trichosporon asahii var. asahii (strain CBS 8904) TaxID=1220162 RepID=K1VFP2_TRIAC|nr:RAB-protein geranylgeranyltransferase [Trichosporon asahii var. asahii CBS 8904]